MSINIKKELEHVSGISEGLYFNDIDIDPLSIKALMINEVVPTDPLQDFYVQNDSEYLRSSIPLFQGAGAAVTSIQEILHMGIYITNAVKAPKSAYTIEKSSLEASLPYLEKEMALFPNIKVIMLMGDVAKKAFNMIAKKTIKKNIIPSVSTYKLRSSKIYYGNILIMPSYIMTGKNILIEKSKAQMVTEDIGIMLQIIN